MKRIPATVITGFLGAGKTSLIKSLIESAHGKRLALIVNEFGDVGVDGAMLAGCSASGSDSGCSEIIELANGCICCTVADDFLPSIEALLAQSPPPDHIIIETSGLALPQPLVQAFNWPDIRNRVMLDGVVTVVDGAALAAGDVVLDHAALNAQRQADSELDHETPIEELFHDQVAAGNLLVVSKGDLLNQNQQKQVMARLKDVNKNNTPIVIRNGQGLPSKVILGLGLEDEAFARSEHHHHHHDHDHHDDHDHGHDEFLSAVVELPALDDHIAFIDRLTALAKSHGLLRAKGFLKISGKAVPLVIQGVGTRIEHYFGGSEPVGDSGQLVLIGLKSVDMATLAEALGGQLTAQS